MRYFRWLTSGLSAIALGLALFYLMAADSQSGTPAATASSPILKGDVNCSGTVDAVDALFVLRDVAALPLNLPQDCTFMGDMDCGGSVDAVDALRILRHVAALSITLPPGCPPIGGAVEAEVTPPAGSSPTPTATAVPTPSPTPVPTATPTATSTPTPVPTPSPTPTATPTPTPVPTATPTPTPIPLPTNPIAFCWMAIISNGLVNGFGSFESCFPALGPSYSCMAIGGILVSCDATYPYGDYDCTITGPFASCDADFLSGFPDYDCDAIGSFVFCNTYELRWPDYDCSVVGDFIFCTTFQPGYSSFTCQRIGGAYFCS